jgi:hypothetical protein
MISLHEETSTKFTGDWSSPMASAVQNAWFDSIAMNFKIPDSIRYMDGMSGKKYRYFINNLMGSIDNARYLEVGSWKGSTAASAVFGNKCKALCIDNWSDFLWGATSESVRGEFEQNLRAASGDTADFNYIDSDFRKVNYADIGKFNVYMFDGPHSQEDQYDGVVIAQPALDDQYVLIVDDYNGVAVKAGTEQAIAELGLEVVASIEIITTGDGTHPQISLQHSDWHNGYLVAVINKKK